MRQLITFSLLFLILSIIWVVSTEYCTPDDEFENKNSTTTEWDEFMNKLTDLTFNTTQNLPCKSNPNENVYINHTSNSDVIWDIRFAVYSERLNNNSKTIEQCYSENQDSNTDPVECNVEELRNCMKEARKAMLADLNAIWDERIEAKLEELAENC